MTHTIRVIDDEEDLRAMMREVLQRAGYDVATAGDGAEGLLALSGITRPCLIILDLLMPGVNGWDFYAEIRSRPTSAQIPVIVHTSSPSEASAGVDSVLQKPTSMSKLLSAVQHNCRL